MLKPVALALLLAWQLEPFYMIEHYRGPGKVSCQTEPVPPGFTCATVFNLDPPLPDGISSIRGGDYAVIRGVCRICLAPSQRQTRTSELYLSANNWREILEPYRQVRRRWASA